MFYLLAFWRIDQIDASIDAAIPKPPKPKGESDEDPAEKLGLEADRCRR